MSGRSFTLPVPLLSRLENAPLTPGQTILIRGFVSEKTRFDINLTAGRKVDGTERDDIALQISCRIEEGKVVLNSLEGNKWGKEERHRCPFKDGEEFDLRIRCHDDKFEIFGQHKELAEFVHRIPLNTITHTYISGDVELHTVSWEGKYYSVPYKVALPATFGPGAQIFLSGRAESGCKRFEVNLYKNDDIALHMNPRFNESAVVRNSRQEGKWAKEEREGEFPFKKERVWDIVIACEDGAFQVYVDGKFLFHFDHHIPPQGLDALEIEGEVELQGVHFK